MLLQVRELQLQVKSTRVQLEAVVANTKVGWPYGSPMGWGDEVGCGMLGGRE